MVCHDKGCAFFEHFLGSSVTVKAVSFYAYENIAFSELIRVVGNGAYLQIGYALFPCVFAYFVKLHLFTAPTVFL